MLNTGTLALSYTSSSSTKGGILVTNGTITGYVAATGSTAKVTNLNYISNDTNASAIGIKITPNAGATSMTISAYKSVTSLGTDPSAGTLEAQAIITVTTTNSSGTLSTTKSGVFYAGNTNAQGVGVYTPAGGSATLVDTTTAGTGTSDFNTAQYALIMIRDAYGSAVTQSSSTPLIINASATNGAYVSVGTGKTTVTNAGGTTTLSYDGTSTPAPGSGTSSNSTTADTGGNGYKYYALKVANPTSAALSTTVTITVNGTVIGTKAFSFTGKVAKVVLSSPTNGKKSSTGSISVAYLDAAGNDVSTSIVSGSSAVYNATVVQDANTSGANGISINGSLGIPVGGSYYTQLIFNCPSTNASGQVAIDYTNPLDASVVVSNAVPVTCSGGADTYTAKLDKTTYKPGEIATLTVTFKDSKGAIAGDYAAGVAGGIAGSGTNVPSVLGANLAPISTGTAAGTTAGTAADVTSNGVATYKFVVQNGSGVDGDYQLTASFPYVNANADGVAATVPYTIASGSTSLNDVLKGIVALIASINKQIAALAKLVTKKK